MLMTAVPRPREAGRQKLHTAPPAPVCRGVDSTQRSTNAHVVAQYRDSAAGAATRHGDSRAVDTAGWHRIRCVQTLRDAERRCRVASHIAGLRPKLDFQGSGARGDASVTPPCGAGPPADAATGSAKLLGSQVR